MQTVLTAAVALLLGAIAAYAWMTRRLGAAHAELQAAREEKATAEAQRAAAQEQIKQLQEDREALKESFTAIAAEQMKSSRDEFLKQAGERFEKSEQKLSLIHI